MAQVDQDAAGFRVVAGVGLSDEHDALLLVVEDHVNYVGRGVEVVVHCDLAQSLQLFLLNRALHETLDQLFDLVLLLRGAVLLFCVCLVLGSDFLSDEAPLKDSGRRCVET